MKAGQKEAQRESQPAVCVGGNIVPEERLVCSAQPHEVPSGGSAGTTEGVRLRWGQETAALPHCPGPTALSPLPSPHSPVSPGGPPESSPENDELAHREGWRALLTFSPYKVGLA